MPIVPKYTKQVFIQTPSVALSAPNPARLEGAYENNLTRAGKILPGVLELAGKLAPGLTLPGKKKKSAAADLPQSGGNAAQTSGAAVTAAPSVREENGGQTRLVSQTSARRAQDGELALRGELINVVRDKIRQNGTVSVSELDDFAVKNFTPENANGTAGADYWVMRRAARETEISAAREALRQNAQTEENLLRGVGALASSPEELKEYLSVQLSSYRRRLADGGLDEKSVRNAVRQARRKTVEANIARSLAAGDWASASGTLEQFGADLPDSVRSLCADKTRASFARFQAQKLWRQGLLETGENLAEAAAWARSHANEPDAQLRQMIGETLDGLERRARGERHVRAAKILEQAARSSAEDALTLLDAQTDLEGEEWDLLRRAAENFSGGAENAGAERPGVERTDAESFTRLYFSGTHRETARAFKRGKISARDYFRLEASRHRRESGAAGTAEELLCRGIAVWMQKKGFSAQDACRAQYAALSSDTSDKAAAWKEIKNWLDV